MSRIIIENGSPDLRTDKTRLRILRIQQSHHDRKSCYNAQVHDQQGCIFADDLEIGIKDWHNAASSGRQRSAG